MAHNSKRNRRHTTVQDGDDYVYPTKKLRESKTRNRKKDANLIKAGLVDHENKKFDAFLEEGEDDQFNDPHFMDYEIDELMDKFGDTADPKDLFPDDNTHPDPDPSPYDDDAPYGYYDFDY